MENIKNWGLLLLFLSAGSLIYCFLLPSGNISKTAKSVLSVALISFVIFPVFGAFSSFRIEEFAPESELDTKSFEDYVFESARVSVEEIISQTVKKITSVSYKTEIFIDKTENGDINIEYVGITFDAFPGHEKEIREKLYDSLGIMPDIKVENINE